MLALGRLCTVPLTKGPISKSKEGSWSSWSFWGREGEFGLCCVLFCLVWGTDVEGTAIAAGAVAGAAARGFLV